MNKPSLLERLYLHDPAQFTPPVSRVDDHDFEQLYRKIRELSPELANEFKILTNRMRIHEQQQLAALFAQGARVGAQLKVELQDPYEKHIDHDAAGPVTVLR